ncbi:hypothetical protein BGZ79_006066 [Entomortierella chlamydospora]|nr:hypothetical protein BGZ79_006066 [Entomortierella chlamydospora]
MHHGIILAPTFSFSMDSMRVGVVLISLMGLFGVTKKSRRIMNLYFACVVLFTFIQGLFTVRRFLVGKGWIQNVLNLSWEAAYDSNLDLIKKPQKEFNCRGFNDQNDRSLELPLEADELLPPCSEILEMRFGKELKKLASVMLCVRLAQLASVLLLSILFKYMVTMNQEEQSLDEEQRVSIAPFSEKHGYYFNEKQEEDASARENVDVESEFENSDYGDGSDHYLNGHSNLSDYEDEQG